MENVMRSALFTAKGKVDIKEFPIPVCDADKILVKIEACGLCTWEQRVFSGVHKTDFPVVGGHEVAGHIVSVGEGVKGNEWHVGEKVVVGVTLPCGSCYFCKTGNKQNCTSFTALQLLPGQPCIGSGGLSEYMMAQPSSIFKYHHVSPIEACVTEPLSCVIHSVESVNPQFGDTCVVIGAGIMGLLHTQLCVKKGTCVIVIDMNEERLQMAKDMGAHYVINPNKEDAESRVKEITNGIKAHAVFDTTPIAAVVEDACKYIGNTGKLMIYSGIYPNKPVSLDPHWIHKESISIMGTANSNDRDFMRAAAMISNGIIDVKPFISGVYPVTEIETALESACKGDKFRNIVTFD